MKIKIENNYADGHESTAIQETQAANGWPAEPPLDHLEEWFEDEGFSYTGDGHTDENGRSVDAGYKITIVEAENPALVGRSYEWG